MTRCLAYLVTDNDEMQRAACDADVIKKLAGILHHINNSPFQEETGSTNDKIVEAGFVCILVDTNKGFRQSFLQ